jgi:hypothetical protein
MFIINENTPKIARNGIAITGNTVTMITTPIKAKTILKIKKLIFNAAPKNMIAINNPNISNIINTSKNYLSIFLMLTQ